MESSSTQKTNTTTQNQNSVRSEPKKMCNIKKQDKKNLSLTPVLLDRHPSAIHLEQGNKQQPEPIDDFGVSQQFCGVSITLASSNNTNLLNNNEQNSFKLVLNSVEHEVCSDSNNFYIKQPVSEDSKKFNKLSINQPRKYSLMTPQEAKLDKEITNCIQQGKNYSHIENKLSVFLKVPSSPDMNKPNDSNNKID